MASNSESTCVRRSDWLPKVPSLNFPLVVDYVTRVSDEGVTGMKVGVKRRLSVPPELGFGPRGAGGPPNATLPFEVEFPEVSV